MDAIAEANKATAAQLQTAVPSPRVVNGVPYVFEVRKASNLSSTQRNAVWNIFEDNMRQPYTASSFGWDPPQKKRELFHAQARFVIARRAQGPDDVLAYTSFRFDIEENIEGSDDPVIYCYELQVSRQVRRSGLGSSLMSDLERLAKQRGMHKVMLTCFLSNINAMAFYKRVGFKEDPISPGHPGQQVDKRNIGEDDSDDDDEEPADYEILSKDVFQA